jgi:hypothetical protein
LDLPSLEEETEMSGAIINLIVQLVAGAAGGNAIGGIMKNIDLGPIAKTVRAPSPAKR